MRVELRQHMLPARPGHLLYTRHPLASFFYFSRRFLPQTSHLRQQVLDYIVRLLHLLPRDLETSISMQQSRHMQMPLDPLYAS